MALEWPIYGRSVASGDQNPLCGAVGGPAFAAQKRSKPAAAGGVPQVKQGYAEQAIVGTVLDRMHQSMVN